MSAKKKPVSTPLHLLQQLSGSLLEHLEDACSQALADAEKLLAKLEKQRGKAQEKLHNGRLKLQDAAKAGKAKAQSKAQKAVGELEGCSMPSRNVKPRPALISSNSSAMLRTASSWPRV